MRAGWLTLLLCSFLLMLTWLFVYKDFHMHRLTAGFFVGNMSTSLNMWIRMHAEYLKTLPEPWLAVAQVFTALGDEQRQRILLTFEPGERLNVSQLVEVSALSRPAVSHHLKILRAAGVLESEKVGKEVYFWINKDYLLSTLNTVSSYITDAV